MSSSPVDDNTPLEYITVESYPWPTLERPKRSQQQQQPQNDDIRKLRHRESQRQSMLRKQKHLERLRRDTRRLEVQLKYLKALLEEQALVSDRQSLESDERSSESTGENPLDDGQAIELDTLLTELLLSL